MNCTESWNLFLLIMTVSRWKIRAHFPTADIGKFWTLKSSVVHPHQQALFVKITFLCFGVKKVVLGFFSFF